VDRAAKFCLVSLLLLALMTSQADGANTQGFRWGLKIGDRLDYVFVAHSNYSYGVASVNERLCIVVNGMPPLPDVVTSVLEVISYNPTAYWANGSLITYGGAMMGIPFLIFVAVGNWPLLADLMFVGLSSDYEIVDDPSLWGIRGGYSMGSTLANTSMLFSKSDGAMYQYYVLVRDLVTDTEVFHNEVNRLVEGVSTPVLVSAAIISAEIVVAVLIIRRYHR